MKKIFFVSVFTVMVSLTAFAQRQDSLSITHVMKYNGVYVFAFTLPERDYTSLGMLHKTVVSETVEKCLEGYVKFAKKQYPDCEAIIVRDISTGFATDNYEVIKFK